MARRDLHTDNTEKDLVIDTLAGDFLTRDSDSAHIDYIVNTDVGQWKQNPLLGVGIFRFLNAPGGLQTAKRITQKQLESDGYDVEKIMVGENGSLDIIAKLEANE